MCSEGLGLIPGADKLDSGFHPPGSRLIKEQLVCSWVTSTEECGVNLAAVRWARAAYAVSGAH